MTGKAHWSRMSGSVLTLLSLAGIELLSQMRIRLPDPAIVLYLNVVVMYAALSGRLASGLISGAVTSLYLFHHLFFRLAIGGQQFHHTIESLPRVIVIALASPAIALIVEIWKRYAERALECSRANAILQTESTERKRGEEALRRSEANYWSLVERAPYGIYRAGLDGKILMVNPALVELLGYTSEAELLAANLFTDIYRNLAQRPPLVGQLRNQERFEAVEVDWQRRDGKPITVRLSGRLVRDEEGERPYFEVIAENMTERETLREQQQDLQNREAAGPLPSGVAQDLNDLLTLITGHSQLLLDCLAPADPIRKSAQEIKSAADQAVSLTHQPANSRSEEGVRLRLLDLSTVVAGMEKKIRQLIGEDIELVTMLGTALGRVKTDAGQLERVILNLASNAREAMPNGGKLIIKTANVDLDEEYARCHPPVAVGGYVMLALSDTGCGMDAETQSHSFEPFFTTKERDNAIGLGLVTVCGVVKQSGGYVGVSSEPGHGATYKVYLPRVEAAVEAAGAAQASRDLP